MKLSRSEIDAEADKLLASLPEKATPANRASFIAWIEHLNDLPIDQVCPDCGGLVSVEGNDHAWIVSCPCGQVKDTLRGL